MKVESHLENLKESIQEIETAIQQGLVKKQRSLGFHTSAAAIDMLEIILHKSNLIDPGFVIKHEWFNSAKKIKEKFNLEFDHKNEILGLIAKIESPRNILCYGKRQDEVVLKTLIDHFNLLKQLFQEVTGYEL